MIPADESIGPMPSRRISVQAHPVIVGVGTLLGIGAVMAGPWLQRRRLASDTPYVTVTRR